MDYFVCKCNLTLCFNIFIYFSLGKREKTVGGKSESTKRERRETERKGRKRETRERTEEKGERIERTEKTDGNRVWILNCTFLLLSFVVHLLSIICFCRQKQKEKEAKEEERRKREEAKEEEKRRKEEEKLEAERKKQKAASNFASFFVSKKQEAKSVEEENVVEAKNFMPFEVKVDMKVAPVCRRTLSEREKSLFDEKCNMKDAERSELYLEQVRKGKIVPRTSSKTWPLEAKDDDVIILGKDYVHALPKLHI